MFLWQRLKPAAPTRLAILSGFMIGTSYIPFPPWAVLFCLCPLWYIFLNENNPKKIFLYGWIAQFVLAIIGFHWIPYTITEFGHLPYVVGLLGLLAFATFTNLHIPLAGVVWFYSAKKLQLSQGKSLVVLALLTALFEKLNPQIFPWYMGYTWYFGDFPLTQVADLIGMTGLSSVAFLMNAWILFICLNIRNRPLFRSQVTYFVLFFSALNLFGLWKKNAWSNASKSVKVLLVQPNIGNQEKQWDIYGPQFKTKTIDKHFEITTPALADKPDFLIWPETSLPEYMDPYFYKSENVSKILKYIRDNKINVVTGAYSKNLAKEKESNSIFVFNSEGKNIGIYKKHILLAFGEYLPLSNLFPSLLKLLPTVADFERGRGPHALEVSTEGGDILKIGPQICYEGLHPWFSKKLVDDGADVFINVTNDSWFGHTFESYQHLYMTMARAIEFRRPIVRVTNTGISAVVDATGKLLEMSPQQQPWAKTVAVPYIDNAPRTFYSRFIYLDHLLVVIGLMYLLKGLYVTKIKFLQKSRLGRNSRKN